MLLLTVRSLVDQVSGSEPSPHARHDACRYDCHRLLRVSCDVWHEMLPYTRKHTSKLCCIYIYIYICLDVGRVQDANAYSCFTADGWPLLLDFLLSPLKPRTPSLNPEKFAS